MAPEHARGDRDLDARADVFSLGCVLFECLAGRPVFVGEHIVALLAKVLMEDAPRLSSVIGAPPALDGFVARMLAKSRDERPREAVEVARALRGMGDVALGRAPRPSTTSAMTRERRWLSALMLDAGFVTGDGATIASGTDDTGPFTLARAAEASGARLESIANGAYVLVWESTGSPIDVAVRAARTALAIRDAMPSTALGMATGRAATDIAIPVGEALDRAASCMRRSAGDVVLDEGIARLLEDRFEVKRTAARVVLVGERTEADATRTFLAAATPCVGRDVELGTLNAVFSECVDEATATAVLVTGDAGIGKSRLRHEWVRSLRAARTDLLVLSAQGDVATSGSAFATAAALVRSAARVGMGDPKSEAQRKLGVLVARFLPEPDRLRVALRVCEMAGVPHDGDGDEALRSARKDAFLLGDQLRAAWEDLLAAASKQAPVVLVIDDLQWADKPSLELIDRALRNFDGLPWIVVALGRPDHAERFPRLWGERGAREIRLGPIKPRAAERLVRSALGSDTSATRVGAIVDRAGGNPYFLEELIRAEISGVGDALPESVLAMVEARLVRLDAPVRRVLRAASIFGAAFEERGVAAVLDEEAVAHELDALTRQELITSLPTGGFAFRQATAREAAYAQLVDEDRRAGHAAAGDWLAASGGTDAAQIATHFERGTNPRRAAPWWAVAAEQALAGNDFATTIERARWADTLGAMGDDLARAVLASVEAQFWRGEVKARVLDAQGIAGRPDVSLRLRAKAYGMIATAAHQLGDVALVATAAERLLGMTNEESADEGVLEAATMASVTLYSSGNVDLADKVDTRVREVFARLPDPSATVRARVLALGAFGALARGDTEACVTGWRESAEAYGAAGNARRACVERGNAGYGLLLLGAHDEAVEALRAALAEASRLGLDYTVASAEQNLGLALARSGALDEAVRVERSSIERFARGGNAQLEAGSRIYLARILLAQGHLDDAESEARRACDKLPADHPVHTLATVALADVLLERRGGATTASALTLARRAYEAVTREGSKLDEPGFIRRVYVEAAEANGLREEADRARAEARAWVTDHAARIVSEGYRKAFLEQEPDNARMLGPRAGDFHPPA